MLAGVGSPCSAAFSSPAHTQRPRSACSTLPLCPFSAGTGGAGAKINGSGTTTGLVRGRGGEEQVQHSARIGEQQRSGLSEVRAARVGYTTSWQGAHRQAAQQRLRAPAGRTHRLHTIQGRMASSAPPGGPAACGAPAGSARHSNAWPTTCPPARAAAGPRPPCAAALSPPPPPLLPPRQPPPPAILLSQSISSDGGCTTEALTVCTHVEEQTQCVRSRNRTREQRPKAHLTPAPAVAAAVAARAAAVTTRAAAAPCAGPTDKTRLGAAGRFGLCRLQALPGAGAAAAAAMSAGPGAGSSVGGRRAGAGLVGSLAMELNPGSPLRRPGGRPRRLG